MDNGFKALVSAAIIILVCGNVGAFDPLKTVLNGLMAFMRGFSPQPQAEEAPIQGAKAHNAEQAIVSLMQPKAGAEVKYPTTTTSIEPVQCINYLDCDPDYEVEVCRDGNIYLNSVKMLCLDNRCEKRNSYSLVKRCGNGMICQDASCIEIPRTTTSTSTSSTLTPSTTSTTVSTLTPSTTSTTVSTLTPSTTSTTLPIPVPTSTTLSFSSYQTALCMSSKADTIYLGPSIPSERLRSYLGQHIHLFNVMECEGSSLCEGPIRDLIGDDKLFYNGRNFRTISYPVVVTAGRGHLIADIKKFEDLMSCGNL